MKYIKDIAGISHLLSGAYKHTFITVNTGSEHELIADFRSMPLNDDWVRAQEEYIRYHSFYAKKDSAEVYTKEIDSVKEIYTSEFDLSGQILDVGGAQGRLRHFLSAKDAKDYISIDPFPEAFENFGLQPNLHSVYPAISRPLYYVAGFAESLPFNDDIFDWVHMRSVLDHFEDARLALKEAHRVLRPGGKILIGLSIKKGEWLKGIPRKPLLHRIISRIEKLISPPKSVTNYHVGVDDHIHDWSYEELIDLLQATSFKILTEHRQKSPYSRVVYLSAQRI